MLYINPESCIDCEMCVAECPVEAIYHEDDAPEEFQADILLNATMSQIHPLITERKS